MSRKRSLAGFDAVASTTSKTNTTVIDNKNNNSNTNDNTSNIDSIINRKKPAKKFTGLYLEKEIADVLDRVTKGTKGAKSEIANAALRRFFEEQGLL